MFNFLFQVDQNPIFSERLSPPRPSTLMLDNGQEMEFDLNDMLFNDNNNNSCESNTQNRNRKKKKRAADIPVKKFNGKSSLYILK